MWIGSLNSRAIQMHTSPVSLKKRKKKSIKNKIDEAKAAIKYTTFNQFVYFK